MRGAKINLDKMFLPVGRHRKPGEKGFVDPEQLKAFEQEFTRVQREAVLNPMGIPDPMVDEMDLKNRKDDSR